MKQYTMHEALLRAIKEKIPQGTNVANILMDILFIGKEAVYRRLRSEVAFTMEEAASISRHFGISLDDISGVNTLNRRPFRLNLERYTNPMDADYNQMEEVISLLNSSRSDPYTEMTSAVNVLPQTLYFNYKYISRFYMFKWLYQWNNEEPLKSLENIEIHARLEDIQKRYVEESLHIKHTCYILDNFLFQYLVNDIRYFASVRFITREDVIALKKDLLDLIDYMELIASKGSFETGNKVQFYLSSTNFDSTYSYLQTENYNVSHIRVFTLNAIVSLDTDAFLQLKNWVNTLKRLSILISESGEMQRVQFFKKQRELVNTLV
ncbi:hypothetical protein JGH11_15340 [Dysgonomonas sp. Marseille-P4677]|uniref:hypothetical protein n=1 Tax=Dysgonomonas sp. Marseille-P4677 TaxID=2364790 RepID=UPI001912EA3E|nr:hypothetical protein [Dysgonomonas sp. Marseille-P4677]MBK5722249.1 hypothetical protein [Dysgonomonas sp. Marseille-P4677]